MEKRTIFVKLNADNFHMICSEGNYFYFNKPSRISLPLVINNIPSAAYGLIILILRKRLRRPKESKSTGTKTRRHRIAQKTGIVINAKYKKDTGKMLEKINQICIQSSIRSLTHAKGHIITPFVPVITTFLLRQWTNNWPSCLLMILCFTAMLTWRMLLMTLRIVSVFWWRQLHLSRRSSPVIWVGSFELRKCTCRFTVIASPLVVVSVQLNKICCQQNSSTKRMLLGASKNET